MNKLNLAVKIDRPNATAKNVIDAIVHAMHKAGYKKEAENFHDDAMKAMTYTEILILAMSYVELK